MPYLNMPNVAPNMPLVLPNAPGVTPNAPIATRAMTAGANVQFGAPALGCSACQQRPLLAGLAEATMAHKLLAGIGLISLGAVAALVLSKMARELRQAR